MLARFECGSSSCIRLSNMSALICGTHAHVERCWYEREEQARRVCYMHCDWGHVQRACRLMRLILLELWTS